MKFRLDAVANLELCRICIVLIIKVVYFGLIGATKKYVFYNTFLSKKIEKTFGGLKISRTFALFLKHKILFYYLI
jgi:hypothetical protein